MIMRNSEASFKHTDGDGDKIRIDAVGTSLLLEAWSKLTDETIHVRLAGDALSTRDTVQELYDVLGQWLDEDPAPEPAVHVDERVTAEDVRRIAADEAMKLLINGAVLDRFRALAQEEVQRNNVQHREQMREISREEIRQYLPTFQGIARGASKAQIEGGIGRDAIVKVMRDTLTRAVELGVDR